MFIKSSLLTFAAILFFAAFNLPAPVSPPIIATTEINVEGENNTATSIEPSAEPLPSGAEENTEPPSVREDAVVWVDNTPHGEGMRWYGESEHAVPAFPDVTFRWTPESISVINEDGSEERLLAGMPVWNAYLQDLTGDGLPEICSTVSMGSGIVSTYVYVYDYAGEMGYTLHDRMDFEYWLSVEDGNVTVTQYEFNNGPPGDEKEIAKGVLKLEINELTADGMERPERTVRTAENTKHEAYFNVVKYLYENDTGLNYGIKYIAMDMANVTDAERVPLEALISEWAKSLDCELLLGTYESLVKEGYIDDMPPNGEGGGFKEGLLFSFSEVTYESGVFKISATKYRGPLGAAGAEFTVNFTDGEWVVEEPEMMWVA